MAVPSSLLARIPGLHALIKLPRVQLCSYEGNAGKVILGSREA